MLARGLARRLPALTRLAQSGASPALSEITSFHKESPSVANDGAFSSSIIPLTRSWHFSRGFASDALAGTASGTETMPATAMALKNPTNIIEYDEHTHTRVAPGDPSKKAFAYLVLTGGRFIYASALRILALKLILSMSASRDVLALASLEVDIGSIEPGSTVTVKWRGKPVFVRHRTEADVKLANSTPMNELRDPEEDSARVQNPEWLVVVGVCTHLGCVPLPNAGDYGGWFCPCHGSHYYISGRIRKGPAPYNLEVPTYKFTEETKLLIG